MKTPARRVAPALAAALHIAPLGADIVAGPGREGGEFDAVLLVRLLDTPAVRKFSRIISAKFAASP